MMSAGRLRLGGHLSSSSAAWLLHMVGPGFQEGEEDVVKFLDTQAWA